MKTKTSRESGRNRVAAAAAAFLATLLALPSANGATSFPQYPLQTGAGQVPPNILFILDDSGSMEWRYMYNTDIGSITGSGVNSRPTGNNVSSDNDYDSTSQSTNAIYDQAYVTNTIYYNPTINYKPWVKADGARMTGGATWPNAYSSNINASGSTTDLSSSVRTFYVPKDLTSTSSAYLGNADNYYRYQILRNGRVQRSELGTVVATNSQTVQIGGQDSVTGSLNDNNYVSFTLAAVSAGVSLSVKFENTSNGNRQRDLNYRLRDPSNNTICDDSVSKGNSVTCTVPSTTAGQYTVRISRDDDRETTYRISATKYDTNSCSGGAVGSSGWINCTYATPTGRSDADEDNNFTTWYSYSRTRTKVAKAGASEAFSQLGNNVRVGFRTIWGRNTFDIPVNDGNSGLFEDHPKDASVPAGTTSRSTWFTRLFSAGADNGTPLKGALQSAGDYFKKTGGDGPYGPETGASQYQCRQNFAILTTDGYWNSTDGYTDVGNQDNTNGDAIKNPEDGTDVSRYTASSPYKDSNSGTLADVAMKYWKSDLRTDLDNIVPTSNNDPAFWQHMVTFGISIGLKGTVDETSVASVIQDANAGGAPRKNGVVVNWPNPNDDENAERIDDLLHAAVNGHGDFIAATNAQQFATALQSALTTIQGRLASGSNVATNSTSFQSEVAMYQATYFSQTWTGDLAMHEVSPSGAIKADPDWTVATSIAKDANFYKADGTGRPVITADASGNGAAFPTDAQKTSLARTVGTDGATVTVAGDDNAKYIKGDQSKEISHGGTLRNRTILLGDIINSSPFYIKDTESIYIGANDGMMHGIDATSGKVLFSYVPAGVDLSALASLSDPTYVHHFFVDGPITVSSRALVEGKNYLVGTLGRGGKGAYALDVSDPSSFTAANVLWDNTTTSDKDMGYVTGAPLIARASNGDLLAFVSNGIDSDNGSATLFVYDVVSGDQVAKIVADAGSGNGLSAPRGADVNSDGIADYIYAGDLKGNLWKFDVTDDDPSKWKVAFDGKPLFVAKDGAGNRQPITGGLALARDPDRSNNHVWVTFGTGRLISVGDPNTTDTQSIYGLLDSGTAITGDRGDALTERKIDAYSSDGTLRAFEDYSPLPVDSRGWYLDLGIPSPKADGERVVSGPRIDGRTMWFSSVIPTAGSGCDSGGSGYLNAIDAFTGTQPKDDGGGTTSSIDVSGDGQGDTFNTGSGDSTKTHHTGSVDLGIGMDTESKQVDDVVLVCGSDGKCTSVHSPTVGGTPKRLGWRELYTR